MNAYYALQDKYVEVGINNKEEIEDLKKFAGDLQVQFHWNDWINFTQYIASASAQ